MKQVENILIWKWKQPGSRFVYTSEQVNAFVKKLRENITLPVTFCCVTDDPEGLDESIKHIPLPDMFSDIQTETWGMDKGLPQCFKRLTMWSPDAEKMFGKRYMMIDLDTIVLGNIDHLLTRQEDVLIFRGTNAVKRPYNGSLVIMDAGARPEVFNNFTQEGATKSGEMFVGSDQAWLSYCLSHRDDKINRWVPHVPVISEVEGVTHYSKTFINRNGGYKRFKPPEGTCLVFFPGDFKIFYNGDTMGGTVAERKAIRRLMGLPEKLILPGNTVKPKPEVFAYDDPKQWGKRFKQECDEQGIVCQLFTKPRDVPENSKCFVRVDQQGTERNISKQIVKDLNYRQCKTIPTLQESVWYDDKVAQFKDLSQWMPDTFLFTKYSEAAEFAKNRTEWPIYSKSLDGAGSATVRKLNNYDEAMAELKPVFMGRGIKSAYNRKQKGYVLWQQYIPNTSCTYRFNVIGDYIMGFERKHDVDGLPIPGENTPMTFESPLEQKFAKIGLEVSDHISTKWMCYDFLLDEEGQFKLLEISSAWPTKPWFVAGQMYTRDFERTSYNGSDMFKIVTQIVKSLDKTD